MNTKKQQLAGEEVAPMARVGVLDVAKHSGVSIATVSRVLNGRANVSSATREKVLQSARVLGYNNAHSVRMLPGEQTGLIGLTSIHMTGEQYTGIIAGITEALHSHNARPVICPIINRHNCGMTLLERVMQHTTDGALLIGMTESEEDLLGALHSGYPFVVLEPDAPVPVEIPVVASANWYGSKVAGEHLLQLGHRRIGVITGRSGYYKYSSNDMLAGFQSTLMAAGVTIDPEYIFDADSMDWRHGHEGALRLLALPEPPSAIFAFSDLLAIGVCKAAQERGLQVPRDLSVIGYGDYTAAQLLSPSLTTLRLPFPEIGRVGVDMLYRLIHGQALDATRAELSPRLVVRDSTAPCSIPLKGLQKRRE